LRPRQHTYKEQQMKSVRNIALAAAAAGALALGSAAFAQETKKPETKPQAGHQHRGEHRGEHRGMSGMREMRGNCHGQSGAGPSGSGSDGEHNHS
jgi:hypothetical protein